MNLPIVTRMSGADRSRIRPAGPLVVHWRGPWHRPAAALFGTLLLLPLLVPPAGASVGPPATVQLLGPFRSPAAGEIYSGELRVTPRLDGALTGFRIEGPGWSEVSWRVPPEAAAAGKGEPLIVGFAALALDPSQPLVVACELDGRPVRKRLDLSPRHFERMTEPALAAAGPEPPLPAVEKRVGLPQPPPLALTSAEKLKELEPGDEPKGTAGWDIRVTGRFGFYREDDNLAMGVDAITVYIKDEDVGIDDTLAQGMTDPDGSFDLTFHWDEQVFDEDPDLYVLFHAENGKVELEDEVWGYVMEYRTGTEENFSGTSWNVGWRAPADEGEHAGLGIFTNIVRTWRWLATYGYDCDDCDIDIQWPDDTHEVSWYDDYYQTIHVHPNSEWSEGTHVHEYGHHFMNKFAVSPSPDYCNGICDDLECGHCGWCRENGSIHFTEGVPDYLGHVIPRSFGASYGTYVVAPYNVQYVDSCGTGPGAYLDDPELTEKFVAALLIDIHDSAQDNDSTYVNHRDVLAMGPQEILATIDHDHPTSIGAFIADFVSRYPDVKEDLWETGMNCGYDFDAASPGNVSGLTSATHPIGSTSPNAEPTFTWARATDDFSGILGYLWSVTAAPACPTLHHSLGDVTTVTVEPLAPGTWWFNIWAQDRAGNWSATWVSYGPFTIREAEPANLIFQNRAGWDYPVVPRSATGATSGSCLLTTTLPGWSGSTYWNVAGRNDGEAVTSSDIRADVVVDGSHKGYATWAPVAGGASFYTVNRGPISVHGGRHTFSGRLDRYGAIMESSETDNYSGHQFIWTPEALAAGVPVTKIDPPPDATGGWTHIVDGQVKYFNADGFTFSTTGWWNAVVLRPYDPDADFDLRLHTASTTSTSGFAVNLGWCSRPADCIDAVLVNKHTVADGWYDVGVIDELEDGTGGYLIEQVMSYAFAFGDSVRYTWESEDFLSLRQVNVTTAGTSVTVKVWTDPPTPGFQFAWYNANFTRGTMLGWEHQGQTGADGVGSLQFLVYDTGYSCVALFRDPRDSTGPIAVTLEVQATPADLLPHLAAGWYAPLVPRPLDDGTTMSVPMPDTLHGNAASTYISQGIRNDGIANAAGLDAYLFVDGSNSGGLTYTSFPAGAVSLYNWHSARTIRGGRHSLALYPDWPQEIEEIREDNNLYGEQWVWSPLVVAATDTMHRGAPPDPTAGWDWITSGEGRYYNCDGLRLNDGAETWRAIGVVPAMSCDVDIRLHAPLAGAKNGFKGNLGISGWGTGLSDYVLINDRLAPPGPYDAGVLKVGGTLPYAVDAAVSTSLGAPNGTYGPYTVPQGVFIRLYELELAADVYAFRLDPVDHEVYWGMALHPSDRPFLTKSSVVEGCLAWQRGPGNAEGFTATIATPGYYCLAVWKSLGKDLYLTGKYDLTILRGVTGVAGNGGVPAVTALASIRPNPCNPRAEVHFDLAREERVELAVYDLKGRRLCDIADGVWPAGRHAVAWDGRDALGREVGSGVYLVRLRAGEAVAAKKITLVR